MTDMWCSPEVVAAPCEWRVTSTPLGASRAHGAGRTAAGRCPRGVGGRSCGYHHPRGSGWALPPAAGGAHTAEMTWLARLRRRSRREVLGRARSCWAGSTLFVVAGLRRGRAGRRRAHRPHRRRPTLGLSVLATAVVALALRSGADPAGVASRRGWSTAASPRRTTCCGGSPRRVTGSHAAEELPARMARVLADGTGAEWAQVWLVVGDRPTWPPPGRPTPPRAAAATRDRGRRPGPALAAGAARRTSCWASWSSRSGTGCRSPRSRSGSSPGWPSQAGLVLRGARLRAELELRLAELSARAGELRASRQRLVDAQDAERRRLERDIHDGAQQHLVALAVNLRLAETLAGRVPRAGRRAARRARRRPRRTTVATLVRLSRGIYPPLLAANGLAAALAGGRRARRRAGPSWTTRTSGRYPPNVEAAAYFCCLEAVQNATKHAGPATIRVTLRGGPGGLGFTVEDDGAGFDPAATPPGAGLANMRDRVESLGGTLTAESRPDAGPGSGPSCRRRAAVAEAVPPSGVPDVRAARVAWVAGRRHRSCWRSPTCVVTAQYRHLLSEEAVAEHGFPFVDGAVLGCARDGRADRLARRPAPDRLAAERRRVRPAPCRWSRRPTRSGWCTRAGPGRAAWAGVAGWLSSLVGGQLAHRRARPDVPARPRRAPALAPVEVRRRGHRGSGSCCASLGVVSLDPATFDLVVESDDIGPVRSALLSLGFLLISVGPARLAGLDAAAAAPEPGRGAPAGAPDRPLGGPHHHRAALACSSSQIVNGGRQTWAASLPLFASYLLLPVLFAIAVLSYRLYDVEVILNRTLVLAAGTAFAALGYTTLVVVVGKLVDQQTSGFWLSLLATALVALAFQPLRRSVVRLANRLAYGPRAQPYEALSDFSDRLAETPSPRTLLPAVAARRRPGGLRPLARRRPCRCRTSTTSPRRGATRTPTARSRTWCRCAPTAGTSAPSRCACPKGRPLRPSDRAPARGPGRPDRGRLPQPRPGDGSSPDTWRSSTGPPAS